MPIPLMAVAGGLQALSGLFGLDAASKQRKEANRFLKNTPYPTETMPDEYAQNQNLATTMAATGLPSEQYQMAMKNIQRQQVSALRAANDRRGGLSVLPSILQGTNDATLNLD